MTIEQTKEMWEVLRKLDKDMRAASKLMGRGQIIYLTELYYQIQNFRTASAHQIRSAKDEPNDVLSWLFNGFKAIEQNVKKSLGEFASSYKIGQWLQSIVGIGPVISAGLISHLRIAQAPTCGHFWRAAGLDPRVRWPSKTDAQKIIKDEAGGAKKMSIERLLEVCDTHWGGRAVTRFKNRAGDIPELNDMYTLQQCAAFASRRPWITTLKTLVVFKAGECFVKFQNNKDDHYGHLFVERRQFEERRNQRGELAAEAARALEEKNYNKDTNAYKCYAAGTLPDAHLHARARRWTTKIFMSHLHHAMHVDYFGCDPPKPYIMSSDPETHTHFLPLPNWPFTSDGKSLKELGD